MVGTSNLGSWNGHWSNQFLSLPQDTIRKESAQRAADDHVSYRMLSDDDPVPFFASLPALGLTLLVVAKPAFRLQRCVCQTEQVPRAKHIRFSAFNPPPRTTDSWLVLHRKGENKGLESTMKLDLHNLHLPSESPRHQHVILFSAWLFRAPSFAIPGLWLSTRWKWIKNSWVIGSFNAKGCIHSHH